MDILFAVINLAQIVKLITANMKKTLQFSPVISFE